MGHESNGTLQRIDMQDAIAWIARNDDTTGSPEDIAGLISVLLVADLFGKKPQTIVRRILRYKTIHGLHVARDEAHAQARMAISSLAQEHQVPGIDLTTDLTGRLIEGLASIDPDATLDLLEVWWMRLLRAHGGIDERPLTDPAALDRATDTALDRLRAACATPAPLDPPAPRNHAEEIAAARATYDREQQTRAMLGGAL